MLHFSIGDHVVLLAMAYITMCLAYNNCLPYWLILCWYTV